MNLPKKKYALISLKSCAKGAAIGPLIFLIPTLIKNITLDSEAGSILGSVLVVYYLSFATVGIWWFLIHLPLSLFVKRSSVFWKKRIVMPFGGLFVIISYIAPDMEMLSGGFVGDRADAIALSLIYISAVMTGVIIGFFSSRAMAAENSTDPETRGEG